MAGTVGRVQDLVVEDGEVEGQAKADGVGGGELGLGNVGGTLRGGQVSASSNRRKARAMDELLENPYLVSLVGSGGSNLALLARGELGEVAVVVTLPTCGDGGQQPRHANKSKKRAIKAHPGGTCTAVAPGR